MKPAPNVLFNTQTGPAKGTSLWTRLNRELGEAATAPRRPGLQGRWKDTHRVSLNASLTASIGN